MENVLLVFGGMSYEHDISIVTASQIFNQTRLQNFNLVCLYVSKKNRFYVYKSENFNINDFAGFDDLKHSKKFKEVVFVSGEPQKLFLVSIFGLKEYLKVSLAINACHGGCGENGKLVAFLESQGVYSSSGSFEGLAISMNKMLFKNLMKGTKVPVVSGFVVNQKDFINDREKSCNRLKFMKFPVVLKPLCGGSSIGLFVAKNREEFEEKIIQAFEFDENVLVEKFISEAREFNIAVVGDCEDYLISEIDEPVKISEVLSFEDKYFGSSKTKKQSLDNDSSMNSQKRKFPADIEISLKDRIMEISKKVVKVLNLSGVVRIDFLYDEKNDKLYVCEVNTVPGSLAFYFFSKGKILINEFVERLICIAQKKRETGNNIKIDFITQIIS